MRWFLIAFMMLAGSAQAIDREVAVQLSRLEQIVYDAKDKVATMQREVRELQRENDDLRKLTKKQDAQITELIDTVLKIQNIDIANLTSGQTKLYDDIPIFNWGTETRDCQGIGRHQQVKNVPSDDGNYTLRYLCYDGRTLHLGTEVHQPPQ